MKHHKLGLWIQQLSEGNTHALELIYNDMKDSVYSFALTYVHDRQLGQDVLQETMIHVYQSAKLFKRNENPRAWILTIAKNQAISLLRKTKNEAALDDSFYKQDGNMETEAEDKIDFAVLLSILPKQEQQIVVLHVIAGLKHREIAELLGIPLGTVCWK